MFSTLYFSKCGEQFGPYLVRSHELILLIHNIQCTALVSHTNPECYLCKNSHVYSK